MIGNVVVVAAVGGMTQTLCQAGGPRCRPDPDERGPDDATLLGTGAASGGKGRRETGRGIKSMS